MRIILPLFLCVLAGLGGCESDSSADSGGSTSLATPRILVTEGESNYSGYMEIFPCVSGTSTYYGNYRGTPAALSMINAMYMISDGAVETGVGTPLLLPVG
ncbi:MAG: hypothetical protein PHV49_04965, partial [Alistipes sp.]|nr:hypothetical protein [Alistipes sp.]